MLWIFSLEINGPYKNIIKLVSEPNLNVEQLIVIQYLRNILDIYNDTSTIDPFKKNDVDILVREDAAKLDFILCFIAVIY